MVRQINYSPAVTAVANYCTINCSLPGGTNVGVPQMVIAATFFAAANTGATGGVVVPIVLNADGTYRPYGTPTTITAAGFLFLVSLVSPVLGVGIAITTLVTGASVYLECDATIA